MKVKKNNKSARQKAKSCRPPKDGIVVDSFKGHNVGDTLSAEYRAAMDMSEGELRPTHFTDQVKLIESASVNTDSLRSAEGYQKTGDLLTLPYTSVSYAEQPYASTTVNLHI